MKKIQNNAAGFSAIEAVLIIVVIVVIGFVGWYVYSSKNKNDKTQNDTAQGATQAQKSSKKTSSPSTTVADETKDWTLVAPKNTDNTFTVKVPKSLLPNGTCSTKELLLAITYNSQSYDYDCTGAKGALGYASIVFGVSSSSVVSSFGTPSSADKVTLADGVTKADKSIVVVRATGDGDQPITRRYEIFEAKSKNTGNNYYAIYSTGVGNSDENYFLKDYEAAVTKGWTLP